MSLKESLKVREGDPITMERWNALVDLAARKVTGPNVVETSSGWHIRGVPGGAAGSPIKVARLTGFVREPVFNEAIHFRGVIVPSVGYVIPPDLDPPLPIEDFYDFFWPFFGSLDFALPGIPFGAPFESDVPVVKLPREGVLDSEGEPILESWHVLGHFVGACIQ